MTEQTNEFEKWWANEASPFCQNEVLEKITARSAWNAATQRCAKVVSQSCLVPPDGGSPTEQEVDVCDEARRRILSSDF